jgi:hypothetical protein
MLWKEGNPYPLRDSNHNILSAARSVITILIDLPQTAYTNANVIVFYEYPALIMQIFLLRKLTNIVLSKFKIQKLKQANE